MRVTGYSCAVVTDKAFTIRARLGASTHIIQGILISPHDASSHLPVLAKPIYMLISEIRYCHLSLRCACNKSWLCFLCSSFFFRLTWFNVLLPLAGTSVVAPALAHTSPLFIPIHKARGDKVHALSILLFQPFSSPLEAPALVFLPWRSTRYHTVISLIDKVKKRGDMFTASLPSS